MRENATGGTTERYPMSARPPATAMPYESPCRSHQPSRKLRPLFNPISTPLQICPASCAVPRMRPPTTMATTARPALTPIISQLIASMSGGEPRCRTPAPWGGRSVALLGGGGGLRLPRQAHEARINQLVRHLGQREHQRDAGDRVGQARELEPVRDHDSENGEHKRAHKRDGESGAPTNLDAELLEALHDERKQKSQDPDDQAFSRQTRHCLALPLFAVIDARATSVLGGCRITSPLDHPLVATAGVARHSRAPHYRSTGLYAATTKPARGATADSTIRTRRTLSLPRERSVPGQPTRAEPPGPGSPRARCGRAAWVASSRRGTPRMGCRLLHPECSSRRSLRPPRPRRASGRAARRPPAFRPRSRRG